VSTDDENQNAAAEPNAFAALAPAPELLRGIAAGTIRRARASLTDLASELDATAEGEDIRAVLAALPEAGDDETDEATTHLDALWARVSGRTPYEQLLSLYLADGVVRDALVAYGELRDPVVDLEGDLDWSGWHDEIVNLLRAPFERDKHIDDRLAMWGRRIAGDAVLWTRSLAGIPEGASADTVAEGAEPDAERFAAALFANHSRRMNSLALAA
jgi:hypothetical protein